MIKAVIFDVDGVLIDSFEANLKFFQDLMTATGHTPPTREMYRTMFHLSMESVIRTLVNTDDENEIRRIWLVGKNRTENGPVRYPTELVTAQPGLATVLTELSQKYTLAIVTSRIRGGVFSLPQLADLENFFKTVVYFEDTEKHKPEPEPLLLACERLGIKTEEAVYIGDAQTDIQAAKSAQAKAIGYGKKTFENADTVTDSFEELPKIISQM